METLKLYCDEMISKYPQHKEEIVDFLQLAIDEVEEGETYQDLIEDLINQTN